VDGIVVQLREQRVTLGIGQRALAAELGWSQSAYSRFERRAERRSIGFVDASEVAAVLGLELTASLHPAGDAPRDKGHQALLDRFHRELSGAFTIRAEVPLPGPGDPRVWDLVLRLADLVIGVEAETRIRDMQALVRRIHLRERDGGVDEIVLLLSDSATNRRLVDPLRLALGERYATPARQVLKALRSGTLLSGSGVLLL
jgi:transcriptional regulator with XRE-family HTH domain